MVVIGILAWGHNRDIIRIIKKVISEKGGKFSVIKSDRIRKDYIFELEKLGINILIVDISKKIQENIFFDILLFDATSRGEYDIGAEKCIGCGTKILYNADVDSTGIKTPDSAVGYGLSEKAKITVSSVSENNDGIKVIYFIKDGVVNIHGKSTDSTENDIYLDKNSTNIYHILAVIGIITIIGL